MKNNLFALLILVTCLSFEGSTPNQKISIINYNYTKVYNLSAKSSLYLKDLLLHNKVAVVIAHSVKCPFSIASEAKINALVEKYTADSVTFIYVNSNPFENKIAEPIELVENFSQHCKCPYILDNNRMIQSLFKIKKNGTMIVLKQNKGVGIDLFYEGPIDDSPQTPITKNNFLDYAIKNALENKASNFNTVETGCRILNH